MPDRLTPWDAIIIGGGPAGSAAAIALARQKKKVLLFEKEPVAHHKVCGEFISTEAITYLSDLGVAPARLGAEDLDTVALIHGRKSAEIPLPFRALSLSRYRLDERLLEIAATAGVTIRRGRAVTGLSRQGAEWSVTQADQTYAADSVFLATGKHNLRNWPRPPGAQNDMIGFKMHFRLHPEQTKSLTGRVEIFLFDGGYAGLEPIEDGRANLCLVVRKSLYKASHHDWRQFLDDLSAHAPFLAARLNQAESCWNNPLAIFGIPYGFLYQGVGSPGLYRLGDQMAVIPSFCGDGMAIALHTAQRATRHFLTGNSAIYHAQVRSELGPQIRKATKLLQWGSSSPLMQKSLHLAFRLNPGLLAMTARMTRLNGDDASFPKVEAGTGP